MHCAREAMRYRRRDQMRIRRRAGDPGAGAGGGVGGDTKWELTQREPNAFMLLPMPLFVCFIKLDFLEAVVAGESIRRGIRRRRKERVEAPQDEEKASSLGLIWSLFDPSGWRGRKDKEKACQLSRSDADARRPDREIGLGWLAPVNITPPPCWWDWQILTFFGTRQRQILTTASAAIVGFLPSNTFDVSATHLVC